MIRAIPLDRTNVRMGTVEEPVRIKKMKQEMLNMTQDEMIEYYLILKQSVDNTWKHSEIQKHTELKERLDTLKTLIKDKNKLFDAIKFELENKRKMQWYENS